MVSIAHAARDISRLRDISTVLIRHGFGEVVARLGLGKSPGTRPGAADSPTSGGGPEALTARAQVRTGVEPAPGSAAVRMRRVLEDLGPTFVKLGQFASTRPDLLPRELTDELKKLQDSVPPVPWAAIREQLLESLRAEPEDLFGSFNEQPLAAGSVAQVHAAVLRHEAGPQPVVVKVQRPGIAKVIASDLDILHSLATLLERAIPETRLYSPTGLVQQFDRAITAELDFTTEADNARRFAHNFAEFAGVKFPHVHREASSKHVLTLEYLDGVKVDRATQAGHSGPRIARLALDIIVKQVFQDGFFHADPHPGNIIILGTAEAPVIAMIDLGMVGRLSPRMRDLTVDVMVAAVRRDYEGIADALYALGTPTKPVDMRAFRADVALRADKYLGRQLRDIELSALLRDLAEGGQRYGLELPADFALVAKALMTVESVGKELDPQLDVFETAKPLFLDLIRQRYSPERLGNELLRRVERLSDATYDLPQRVQDLLDDLRLGRVRVQTVDPEAGRAADRLGRRILSGLVVGSLVVSGAWLVASTHVISGSGLIATGVLWLLAHSALDAYRSFRRK